MLSKESKSCVKKYCLKNKVSVNIVFYKGLRPFKYHIVPITAKNISDYVNSQKNLDEIIEKISDYPYR